MSAKEIARQILNQLPDNATWQEIAYALYVRGAIEQGLRDCTEGRTKDMAAVFAKYGIEDEA